MHSTEEILAILMNIHPPEAWARFPELRTYTGFATVGGPLGNLRSIDLFVMGLWPSNGFERVAYEIKINRNDWLNELKNPLKRLPAFCLSHKFWFVLGPGVYKQGDEWGVPEDFKEQTRKIEKRLWRSLFDYDGAGIMEIQEDSSKKIINRPTERTAWPMPEGFIAALLRRGCEAIESKNGKIEREVV